MSIIHSRGCIFCATKDNDEDEDTDLRKNYNQFIV